MINMPTLVVGAAVSVILAVAAYFTYRSARAGGCSECRRCEHCSQNNCSENPKMKHK